MAAQLKLSRQYWDGGSEVSSLNLYANASGFTIADNGWKPKVMRPDETKIDDVITLHVIGTSHDNLSTLVQNLSAKVLEVIQHATDIPTQQNVWLVDQLSSETSARKAFIFDAEFHIGDTLHGPPTSPGNFISECKLAITRGHWEAENFPSALESSAISTLGGSYNYGTIVGDIPARISRLDWEGNNGGGGPLYEFWTGFRTNRYGTVANFVPVWECEDGTNGTDASDDTTSEVNTASPGGGSGAYVEVDFSTSEALVARSTVEIEDVTADDTDQRGVFAVLLRAKVESSTTCRVRLLDGFSLTGDWRTQSRVVVSSTSWFMYPLGTVTIPPTFGYQTAGVLDKFALRIEAERVSGSGSLLLDCLVLVPMSEGFIHASGGITEYSGGDQRDSQVSNFSNGDMVGISYYLDAPISNLKLDYQNYGLPVGNGTLYLVAQRQTQQVLTDKLDISIIYSPRWLLLRGSE